MMNNVEMSKRIDSITTWLDENNFKYRMFDLYITITVAEPICLDGEEKRFEVGLNLEKNFFMDVMGQKVTTEGNYDIFYLCKEYLEMERHAIKNSNDLYQIYKIDKNKKVENDEKPVPVGYYDVPRDYRI